ncbi:protein translocase subunit secA [Methylobacterium sp. 174MFSha1.1]|uniref:preprotein translocase subunit SecA n=1 Tax=Methylobacterium sp. 174MFSha1.1 TaxID=1502749 RepID=UPI0008EDC331|nr:preprotein translocase subunit SecA [Methylobacterium sp. 174MFSha1.1]SFV05318.1 protein translocase subunit secA [Methylobacterium sp. 174MFSha1.1]
MHSSLFTDARGALTSGPYAEREDRRPWAFDRFCETVLVAVSPRLASARRLARRVRRVAAHHERFAKLSDAELRAAAQALRPRFLRRGLAPSLVAEAFALVREISGRELGMRHHPVQIMGAWTMLDGRLAEMQTGEGKTITALLAAATAALAGVPVHVVTVNDYLAKRDSETLTPVYAALGLTVGLTRPEQDPASRRAAYACDVTYCTNKDIAFDYLRDRIALGRRRGRAQCRIRDLASDPGGTRPLLMRGLHFAIVDEADSVLIDEARTPLILSGTSDDPDGRAPYAVALDIARRLLRNADYTLEPNGTILLTSGGEARLRALAAGGAGLWRSRLARNERVTQALSALHLYRRDVHYVIADGKVVIVDESTGRLMPDRSWERGLHQLIEVKEGCEISGLRTTLAKITYQRFFSRYLRLAGMTGTAADAARELRSGYGLSVVRIPSHRPSRRRDLGTCLFTTEAEKWRAVTASARRTHEQGRPVLIGTRSVAASEAVSRELSRAGLDHQVLNARQDAAEADVVAGAGRTGTITVATNMAGRGTDIKITDEVSARGGLHVILTEYHDSRRIDRQLFGRCGRQGDPGTHEAIVALDDTLFRQHAPRLAAVLGQLPGVRLPAFAATVLRCVAQKSAARLHARQRRNAVRSNSEADRTLAFAGFGE